MAKFLIGLGFLGRRLILLKEAKNTNISICLRLHMVKTPYLFIIIDLLVNSILYMGKPNPLGMSGGLMEQILQ